MEGRRNEWKSVGHNETRAHVAGYGAGVAAPGDQARRRGSRGKRAAAPPVCPMVTGVARGSGA